MQSTLRQQRRRACWLALTTGLLLVGCEARRNDGPHVEVTGPRGKQVEVDVIPGDGVKVETDKPGLLERKGVDVDVTPGGGVDVDVKR